MLAAGLRARLSPASKVRREEPLANRTTLRVGGAARIYAEPAGADDLRALLLAAAEAAAPIFMLGRGSNLIVSDEGVEGIVVSLAHEAWSRFEARPDGRLWVGAGLRLKNLCGLAEPQPGLAGCEFLEGHSRHGRRGLADERAGAMERMIFDLSSTRSRS